MHKTGHTLYCFLFLLMASLGAQPVVLNEVMSINLSTIADEDADYSDWLELYNPRNEAVNLKGYGLSDRTDNPFKWILPSVLMAPHDHLFIFTSGKDRHELVYWQTLVEQGDMWSYNVGKREPDAQWNTLDFDASAWTTGESGFGYSDGDDQTVIEKTLSVYVRKEFSLDNLHSINRAVLHIDYDDAFIAYLNGVEVARANIGLPGDDTRYNATANGSHEALMIQGKPPERFDLDISLLQEGDNLLAIQGHNVGINSSDMSLIPFFSIGRSTRPATPGEAPDVLNLASAQLHANFKIKRGGETIVLTDSSGVTVDTVRAPYLPPDISYGRTTDGASAWAALLLPTPGSANIDSLYLGVAAPPVFSHQGGLYENLFSVELTDTTGSVIYYTVDGSDPDEGDEKYVHPIEIRNTTAIRARSFHPSLQPSQIVTNTFIFNENSSFAVIALNTEPDNLFDHEYGIFERGPNANNNYPYFGANFWQDWERPVHVEFFEPTGELGFKLNAGIKVFGGWSRGRAQKSVALFQRAKYDSRKIDYQIFPDKPIDHFESIILRNGGNDWDGTIFRDAFFQSICKDRMDLETMAYRPAHIYLNGEYWGILNVREKINEHYLAANRGLDPDRVDILDTSGWSDDEIMAGTNEDYREMWAYIETHDLSNPLYYQAVDSMMDINNFIDYQVAQIYIGNTDWPGNNIKYYKPQMPGGKWRWLIYDTDFGFNLYDTPHSHNTLRFATDPNGPGWPNPPWSTFLLRSLLKNDYFTRLFINRFADHINTTFDAERVLDILDEFDNEFKPEIDRQRKRWPGSVGSYSVRMRRMETFAKRRKIFITSFIRSKFQISSDIDVRLTISEPGVGKIKVNSVVISEFPWQSKYFKDIPITLTAIPNPGYRFVGWDKTLGHSMTATFDSHNDLYVKALFQAAEPSDVDIVINEINYNSGESFPAKDWIEFYNPQDVTVDIGGWQVKDDNADHLFSLPEHAHIPAFAYAVVCTDTSHFNAVYSHVANVYGDMPFDLNNAGDAVILYDAAGRLVDSLSYDDDAPWPVNADGEGYTLELQNVDLDNKDSANWAASSIVGGTPGRGNSIVTTVERTEQHPTEFGLAQNYPNPFNGMTSIHYSLAAPAEVTLSIYDLLGRQVDTLIREKQNAGRYKVSWHADTPTGIYFYRLTMKTNDNVFHFVKKMALVN